MNEVTWSDADTFGPIESSLVWTPMRPTVDCPECGRRGRVQRRVGVKTYVAHVCPGPFVLQHVECDPRLWRATFRVRLITPVSPAVPLVVEPRPLVADEAVQ